MMPDVTPREVELPRRSFIQQDPSPGVSLALSSSLGQAKQLGWSLWLCLLCLGDDQDKDKDKVKDKDKEEDEGDI